MILETISHHIPCVQIFPVCGGSTLCNFHTGNLVLIWLIYGTSARSTVVRGRPGLTYRARSSQRTVTHSLDQFTKMTEATFVVDGHLFVGSYSRSIGIPKLSESDKFVFRQIPHDQTAIRVQDNPVQNRFPEHWFSNIWVPFTVHSENLFRPVFRTVVYEILEIPGILLN
jgi:hypothetical protein